MASMHLLAMPHSCLEQQNTFWWVVRELYTTWETFTQLCGKLCSKFHEWTHDRTNEHRNGRTERQKLYTPRHKYPDYNNPIRAFMPFLVTCQVWQISYQRGLRHHFFHHSRACNSKVTGQILPEFEPIQDLMPVLVTLSLMKIEFTVTEKEWRHHFLHYKSMGNNF